MLLFNAIYRRQYAPCVARVVCTYWQTLFTHTHTHTHSLSLSLFPLQLPESVSSGSNERCCMKNITKTHLSNRAISRRFVRAIEMIAKASIILPARNNHDHIITRVVSLYPHPKLPPPVGLTTKRERTVIRQISSNCHRNGQSKRDICINILRAGLFQIPDYHLSAQFNALFWYTFLYHICEQGTHNWGVWKKLHL